jgi:hypothetical protein
LFVAGYYNQAGRGENKLSPAFLPTVAAQVDFFLLAARKAAYFRVVGFLQPA